MLGFILLVGAAYFYALAVSHRQMFNAHRALPGVRLAQLNPKLLL